MASPQITSLLAEVGWLARLHCLLINCAGNQLYFMHIVCLLVCQEVVALDYLYLQDHIATHLCDEACRKSSCPSSSIAVRVLLHFLKISKARSTAVIVHCLPPLQAKLFPICSTLLHY